MAQPIVDLDRYLGKWYEIAKLPTPFEFPAARNVTATYTKIPEWGVIQVENQESVLGKRFRIQGYAVPVNASNNRLKVYFPSVHTVGDYWIWNIAPNYSYAMVGSPDRQTLWILSRMPYLDDSILHSLLYRAHTQLGYDTRRVRLTDQTRDV